MKKFHFLNNKHHNNFFSAEFLPYIDIFFDDTILCSNGYTARDSLRTVSCNIIADYIYNVRKNLTTGDICKSINYFSKHLLDPTLPVTIHHSCCRLLLSFIDLIKPKPQQQQQQNQQQQSEIQIDPNFNTREVILKVLEVMVTKFKSIAKSQVSQLMDQVSSTTQPTTETSETPVDEKLDPTTTESTDTTTTTVLSEQSLKKRLEAFLQTNEEKEPLKVYFNKLFLIKF